MPSRYPFDHFLVWTPDVPVHVGDAERIAKHQGVLEELHRVFPGKEPSLRAHLGGIPLGVEMVLFTIKNPLGLHGYRFEGMGTAVPQLFDALTAIAKGQFLFTLSLRTATGAWETIPLAMWERRVCYNDGPAFVVARWNPSHGETMSPQGLVHVRRVKDATRVLSKGMKLLQKLAHGGRRRGSYTQTDHQVLERVTQAAARIHQRGDEVTIERLTEELDTYTRQTERYLQRLEKAFGLPLVYFKTRH